MFRSIHSCTIDFDSNVIWTFPWLASKCTIITVWVCLHKHFFWLSAMIIFSFFLSRMLMFSLKLTHQDPLMNGLFYHFHIHLWFFAIIISMRRNVIKYCIKVCHIPYNFWKFLLLMELLAYVSEEKVLLEHKNMKSLKL